MILTYIFFQIKISDLASVYNQKIYLEILRITEFIIVLLAIKLIKKQY